MTANAAGSRHCPLDLLRPSSDEEVSNPVEVYRRLCDIFHDEEVYWSYENTEIRVTWRRQNHWYVVALDFEDNLVTYCSPDPTTSVYDMRSLENLKPLYVELESSFST